MRPKPGPKPRAKKSVDNARNRILYYPRRQTRREMAKKKAKKPAPRTYHRTCDFCGEAFEAKRRWQRFCSPQHRNAAWYRQEQERRSVAAGFEERLRRLEQAAGLRQS